MSAAALRLRWSRWDRLPTSCRWSAGVLQGAWDNWE